MTVSSLDNLPNPLHSHLVQRWETKVQRQNSIATQTQKSRFLHQNQGGTDCRFLCWTFSQVFEYSFLAVLTPAEGLWGLLYNGSSTSAWDFGLLVLEMLQPLKQYLFHSMCPINVSSEHISKAGEMAQWEKPEDRKATGFSCRYRKDWYSDQIFCGGLVCASYWIWCWDSVKEKQVMLRRQL